MNEHWAYVLSDPARRDMRSFDQGVRERIFAALDRYSGSGVGDVRKLAGREAEWRLRVGNYRVLFTLDVTRHVIVVLRVRHRQGAYSE